MKTRLYENTRLQDIIEIVCNGLVGTQENETILITNTIDKKYDKIAIRPDLIDITSNVLKFIGDTRNVDNVDYVDTEILEFMVYTIATEENEKTLLVQTLSETILFFPDILNSTGWALDIFSDTE